MKAFYSAYHDATARRALQVRRLHIYREDGKWAGKQGLCGVDAWDTTNAPKVVLDPLPARPPDGLTWCPRCVGMAAERLGFLDEFAARVAGGAA